MATHTFISRPFVVVSLLIVSACITTEAEVKKIAGCTPPAAPLLDMISTLDRKFPEHSAQLPMSEEQTKVFMEAFNASPPQSDIQYHSVRAWIADDKRVVVFIMEDSECVRYIQALSHQQFRLLVKGIPLSAQGS